jgi:hypothetical protein
MSRDKKDSLIDRRRIKRLDHIFPVEFQFLDEKKEPLSGWYQAFSQDIGQGGLCLTVNHLSGADEDRLRDKNSLLALSINIPVSSGAIRATGRPTWSSKLKEEPFNQFLVGVAYAEIEERDNQEILKYIRTRQFFKALAISFSLLLSLGLVLAGFTSAKLRLDKERLIGKLASNFSEQRQLQRSRDSLKFQINEMKFLLSQSDRKTELLEERISLAKTNDQQAVAGLTASLDFLKQHQDRLKDGLAGLMTKQVQVETDVQEKAGEASLLKQQILDKLRRWLDTHQNNATGLVASFEGSQDTGDWAFTYDQALAAMVFINKGDEARARRIFDFYLTAEKMDGGGMANAYYASSGDVAEYIVHVGPNVWMGLAMLQYAHQTKDMKYLAFVEDIASWLSTVKDKEGGLRGGKDLPWYSTEHNLDAYALYKMLSELTGQESYKKQADETLAWLSKNAFSRIGAPAVKRGKGDATIATDTYAWSVTAIGPEELKNVGMDPDGIMDFAITNCSVTVEYAKPDGPSVLVRGFDFAKAQNLARGGVVSCEWTAQMILALKIMVEYYGKSGDDNKALYYQRLADVYIAEMSKMIITSPSPVGQGDFCLPYASHEFADTGHGWRTPKGNRTGSVAATAYTILAIEDFNPLRFNDEAQKVR